MAINNIEERVERSIFERIRKNVVLEQYLPDISNGTRYPVNSNGALTEAGQNNWLTDCKAIKQAKGFCVDVLGASTTFSKGPKESPRIVIIPKRIIPGDIGFAPGHSYAINPLSPDNFIKLPNPQESANMHFDVHLVSTSVKQSRFLNAILQRTLGLKKYLPFYDLSTERFFIKYYNYYDVSDTNDSTEENVYSYEVQDLYLFDINNDTIDGTGTGVTIISPIYEIDTEFIMGYREVPGPGNIPTVEPEFTSDAESILIVGQMPTLPIQ